MKKHLLALSAVIALCGCEDSSLNTVEEFEAEADAEIEVEAEVAAPPLQTTKVRLQFNLDSRSELQETQHYTGSGSGISTMICDPDGLLNVFAVKFVHVEQDKWDVYFELDEEFLDIEGGEIGGTGQTKASLLFDENGDFIKQEPYVIYSTEIEHPDVRYQIEIDFYTDSTTNYEVPFTVSNIDANGC